LLYRHQVVIPVAMEMHGGGGAYAAAAAVGVVAVLAVCF
jgi:hypothetical protein